jgi:hypothetical protein
MTVTRQLASVQVPQADFASPQTYKLFGGFTL